MGVSIEMRLLSLLGLVVFLVAAPAVAHAEVMDKELSTSEVWAFALFGGAALVLAWRVSVWLGVLVTGAVGLFLLGLWAEITDPHVGPSILAEAGNGYVANAILATLLVTLLALHSCLRAFARRRRPFGARPPKAIGGN